MHAVIIGGSTFAKELAKKIQGEFKGKIYFVISNKEEAFELSMDQDLIVIHGDASDTKILEQLKLEDCSVFVAASKKEELNILAALYAKNYGVPEIYARITNIDLEEMIRSIGIIPVNISKFAASSLGLKIVKPKIAELVGIGYSEFIIDEVNTSSHKEAIGIELGKINSEELDTLAVAQNGGIKLGNDTIIEEDSKLIVLYKSGIKIDKALKEVCKNVKKEGEE